MTMLTTVATVKAELNITGEDEACDQRIAGLIERASSEIEVYCRRDFAVSEKTDIIVLDCPAVELYLDRRPVVSITRISENGGSDLTADDYRIGYAESGLIYRLGSNGCLRLWPSGQVLVTYQAGYILPSEDGANLPKMIEQHCLDLVLSNWHAAGRDPALKSERVEGVSEETYFASGVPTDIWRRLLPFCVTS